MSETRTAYVVNADAASAGAGTDAWAALEEICRIAAEAGLPDAARWRQMRTVAEGALNARAAEAVIANMRNGLRVWYEAEVAR